MLSSERAKLKYDCAIKTAGVVMHLRLFAALLSAKWK